MFQIGTGEVPQRGGDVEIKVINGGGGAAPPQRRIENFVKGVDYVPQPPTTGKSKQKLELVADSISFSR